MSVCDEEVEVRSVTTLGSKPKQEGGVINTLATASTDPLSQSSFEAWPQQARDTHHSRAVVKMLW